MSPLRRPRSWRLPDGVTVVLRASEKYAHALPVILAISVATFILASRGWLDHFEHAGLDTLNVLTSPRDPSHLVLVGITDDDYRDYFAETSPLDALVLAKIIDAIAAGRPRVIGVDVDTSSNAFQRLQVPESWPPVVWGRDAIFDANRATPGRILGGERPRPIDSAGIAAVPQDADGVVRRSVRVFQSDGQAVPSFATELVRLACVALAASSDARARPPGVQAGHNGLKDDPFCKAGTGAENSGESIRLNFSGERYNYSPLSIRHVLKASQSDGWRRNSPFKDKVVLLGGSYRAARDSYVTPVGTMTGLQITAQAIESHVSGGITSVNHLLALLLDVLAGLTVVAIQHRFRLLAGLALTLLVIPFLALAGSFLAFFTFAWWVDFVPVTFGVLIHELYHHAAAYQRLRTEHSRLANAMDA